MREDIENRRFISVKRGSSFCVPLEFYNKKNNTIVDVTDFKYIYRDSVGHEYVVQRYYHENLQKIIYENCFIKDGLLFAKFEDYSLIKGRLTRDLYLKIPFDAIEGDYFNNGEMTYIRTEQSIICLI